MPRIRRNNGVPIEQPREGRGELVKPERVHGSRGSFIPTGTRHDDPYVPLRYETVRNGLPPMVPYDPSSAARKARAADPRYAHARRALALAEARFGPRPTTLRGLTRKKRRTPPIAATT